MRRATKQPKIQIIVVQGGYERTHRRDQRPSHPQSNISGGASRQAGNRFANFPLRIQLLSSTDPSEIVFRAATMKGEKSKIK